MNLFILYSIFLNLGNKGEIFSHIEHWYLKNINHFNITLDVNLKRERSVFRLTALMRWYIKHFNKIFVYANDMRLLNEIHNW